MKELALAVSLCAVAAQAGPVGRYLGFALGRTEVSNHVGRDSIHFYLPSPSDSVYARVLTDTSAIIADRDSNWVRRQHVTGDTEYVYTDTVYEAGDSLLYQPQHIGDSLRRNNLYAVPFAVGRAWPSGLAGTYHYDIDGDGSIDTVTIWADTMRVEDIEDVTVPYGVVRGCYKIKTTVRQALGITYQGVPARETTDVVQYEWYKDSLCLVKDSTYVFARAYVNIVIWFRAADLVSRDRGELASLYTPVEEPTRPAPPGRITVDPSPFRGSVAISVPSSLSPSLQIFDRTGRRVRTLSAVGGQPSAVGSSVWDGRDDSGRDLPAGTYFIRPVRAGPLAPTAVVKAE